MVFFIGDSFSGPCIVVVNLASSYEPSRYYGPFENMDQCKKWMDIQYDQGFRGSFGIEPIRTPYKVRKNDDWWMRDDIRKPEELASDFPSKSWFSIKGWKKFLKSSRRIKSIQRYDIRQDYYSYLYDEEDMYV